MYHYDYDSDSTTTSTTTTTAGNRTWASHTTGLNLQFSQSVLLTDFLGPGIARRPDTGDRFGSFEEALRWHSLAPETDPAQSERPNHCVELGETKLGKGRLQASGINATRDLFPRASRCSAYCPKPDNFSNLFAHGRWSIERTGAFSQTRAVQHSSPSIPSSACELLGGEAQKQLCLWPECSSRVCVRSQTERLRSEPCAPIRRGV